MRTIPAVALLAIALAAPGLARSQETQESPTPPEAESEHPQPTRTIRVLQSPYDLASFYSARPGVPTVTPPVPHDPAYALAEHYRSPQGGAPSGPGPWFWAAFWAQGYGAHRPTPLPGYRRTIGENGDLFLAVPFLAPVGPLSGSFPGF